MVKIDKIYSHPDSFERCQQKGRIIKKIKEAKNWDLLDDIEKQLEEQPIYIKDYIKKLFEEKFGHLGVDGAIGKFYCKEEVLSAFEYDVRRAFIKIKRENLIPESDYINHWTELYVRKRTNSCSTKTYLEDLDFYINQCMTTAFHTYMIAETIFQIWCEKVTFKEP